MNNSAGGRHVLGAGECAALIQRANKHGFELAPITTASGFEVAVDVRNNDRVIFDDETLADDIWQRVRAAIPARVGGRQAYLGGQTRFQDAEVVGRTGMALVFRHEMIHEGAEVARGVKYALRSDVMYGRAGEMRG